VPIEAELLLVIDVYLESRANRFPAATKRTEGVAGSPYRDGPHAHRCSSAATVSASPGEHCNLESNGPSNVPDPTRSPSQALWYTGYGTPTRQDLLVQTTAGKWITHPPARCPNGHTASMTAHVKKGRPA
jgi:hypothetical protein